MPTLFASNCSHSVCFILMFVRECFAIAKAAQTNATIKALSKRLQSQRRTKLFLKNFQRLKKIKNATHSRHSMTQKLNTDNGLQGLWTRTTGYNTGLAKVAVQCSADTFVVKIANFLKPQNVRL